MLKDYRRLPKTPPKHLAVLLHGVGSDGRDLIGLADGFAPALPDCAFVSPDAPEAFDQAPFGRQWFSLRDRTLEAIEAGLKKARPVFDAYLGGLLKEFNVPAARTALVGFSQGTMVSLYCGLRRPEPLAGILAYSGMLAGGEKLKDEMRIRPPICLIHGDSDEVVPAAASRMAAHMLEKEAVPVELHISEGLGHGIDQSGLKTGAAFLHGILAG